jgi:uncharacterized membrane protein YdbT with pleckstrin-like domain
MPDGQPVVAKRMALRAFAGLYLVLGVVALAIWGVGFGAGIDVPASAIVLAGLVPLLIGVAYTWLVRATTEYRIFEDALEVESGILAKDIEHIQLFRIRDLGLSQSLVARVLGIGTVTIASTDRSQPELALRGLTRPRELYETIRRLVSASQATRRTMVIEDDTPPSR